MPMHVMRRAGASTAVAWVDTDSSGVVENWVCHHDQATTLLGGSDPGQERWRLHRLKNVLDGYEFERMRDDLTDEF